MNIYSVTVRVSEKVQVNWLTWMRDEHIPDVLRTGCFVKCELFRLPVEDSAGEMVFRSHYYYEKEADLERYLKDFAPALKKDHEDRYGGKATASRFLMHRIAVFS